jgi:hypothetical protein
MGHSFSDGKRARALQDSISSTEAWFKATEKFSAAIRAMTGKHNSMAEADYVLLRATAEEARLESENARVMESGQHPASIECDCRGVNAAP